MKNLFNLAIDIFHQNIFYRGQRYALIKSIFKFLGGTAYVLTNPAIKGLVKIGKTNRSVSSRPADLYRRGVALPFACVYAGIVKDVDETEKAFHEAFEPSRNNTKREFFEIKPSQAIAVLKQMAIEDVTLTVQDATYKVDI